VRAHPAIAYTLSRLLLFGAATAVLYLFGARGLLLVALAALASGLTSFVLLSRQRDAMSAAVSERLRRTRERMDAFAAAEDVDDDEPDPPGR
jgi:Mn2+/Fe2+ NRAMP family transporter